MPTFVEYAHALTLLSLPIPDKYTSLSIFSPKKCGYVDFYSSFLFKLEVELGIDEMEVYSEILKDRIHEYRRIPQLEVPYDPVRIEIDFPAREIRSCQ